MTDNIYEDLVTMSEEEIIAKVSKMFEELNEIGNRYNETLNKLDGQLENVNQIINQF